MIKKLSTQTFTEATSAPVAIVDFSAVWCGPCKMLAPVMEELSEMYAGKAAFFNVDIDDDQALAMRYGVQAVPTVIMLKNGQVAATTVGFQPKAGMDSWIQQNL